MVRINVLSRDETKFTPQRPGDVPVTIRSNDPSLHPLQRAREYTRASNAAKLDRVFAKPFIGDLNGHSDGVYVLSTVRSRVSALISGSGNGEVKFWDLGTRTVEWEVRAHDGFVRGITGNAEGTRVLTCGDDKTVKVWENSPEKTKSPVNVYMGGYPFLGMDYHVTDNMFATCGLNTDIWDTERSEPIHSFNWGSDSMLTIKFNQVENNLLAVCGSDRSIVLYDIRQRSPLRKVVLRMNSNALAWNPMEAFHFTVANEDHKLYTFDARRLDQFLNIHEDHVSAVMSVAYSPTGKEFVSGSYDKAVRIFSTNAGHSREVYHTKRMQRVFAVEFSRDSRFVFSGSDDTNVRIWKSKASEKLGSVC